jgi:hypothetical protein
LCILIFKTGAMRARYHSNRIVFNFITDDLYPFYEVLG